MDKDSPTLRDIPKLGADEEKGLQAEPGSKNPSFFQRLQENASNYEQHGVGEAKSWIEATWLTCTAIDTPLAVRCLDMPEAVHDSCAVDPHGMT